MSERLPVVRKGQLWTSNDGKRVVRITKFDAYWDDCRWVNVQTGTTGAIYAGNLRGRYKLTAEPEPMTEAEA